MALFPSAETLATCQCLARGLAHEAGGRFFNFDMVLLGEHPRQWNDGLRAVGVQRSLLGL